LLPKLIAQGFLGGLENNTKSALNVKPLTFSMCLVAFLLAISVSFDFRLSKQVPTKPGPQINKDVICGQYCVQREAES